MVCCATGGRSLVDGGEGSGKQMMDRKSGDAGVGVQKEGKLSNEGWAFGTLHKEG